MSEERLFVAKFDTQKQLWVMEFEGKLISERKELAWLKSTFRKSAKSRKLNPTGLRCELENGKTYIYPFLKDGEVVVKEETQKISDVTPEKVEVADDELVRVKSKEVTVEGMEGLKGHQMTGRLIGKRKGSLVVQFSTRKEKVAFTYEFNARTGIQKTSNPYQLWKLNVEELVA